MDKFKQLKQEIPNFFWYKVLTISTVVLYLIINIYLIAQIKDIIDSYVKYNSFGEPVKIAFFLATIFFCFVLMIFSQYFIKQLEAKGSRELKSFYFRKIIYKKNDELMQYDLEKIKKIVYDAGLIGKHLVTYEIILVGKTIAIALFLFVLAYYNLMLMIVMMLLYSLIFIGTHQIREMICTYYYKSEEENKKMDSSFSHIFSGISVVKQLKTEKYFIDKFNDELLRTENSKSSTICHTLYISLKMLSNLCIPLLSILIGIAFFGDEISIGELVIFFTFLVLINEPINDTMIAFNRNKKMEEVFINHLTILGESEKKENFIGESNNLQLVNRKGFICFKNEQISEEILNNILKNVKKKGLLYSDYFEERVKFVEHYSFLFEGTLYDNICMGYNASIEEIDEVLDMMMLKDFVRDLSLQYEIKNDGKNLSIYQKQRIAIARILLRKPKYLFLDELPVVEQKNRTFITNKLDIYAKKNDMTIIILSEQ